MGSSDPSPVPDRSGSRASPRSKIPMVTPSITSTRPSLLTRRPARPRPHLFTASLSPWRISLIWQHHRAAPTTISALTHQATANSTPDRWKAPCAAHADSSGTGKTGVRGGNSRMALRLCVSKGKVRQQGPGNTCRGALGLLGHYACK